LTKDRRWQFWGPKFVAAQWNQNTWQDTKNANGSCVGRSGGKWPPTRNPAASSGWIEAKIEIDTRPSGGVDPRSPEPCSVGRPLCTDSVQGTDIASEAADRLAGARESIAQEYVRGLFPVPSRIVTEGFGLFFCVFCRTRLVTGWPSRPSGTRTSRAGLIESSTSRGHGRNRRHVAAIAGGSTWCART